MLGVQAGSGATRADGANLGNGGGALGDVRGGVAHESASAIVEGCTIYYLEQLLLWQALAKRLE